MRSSGPDPVTGPGDVERDKKGKGLRGNFVSLAPSTKRGMAGDGGLLVAEELLLSEDLSSTYSVVPSLLTFLGVGVIASGEALSVGVPN